ncbi:hypothetical protein LMG33818_002094 [Halomonadaceae bacterium LMG 33818]|uniref:hypothetical protein n=1 Tax=Cernens ardua TaxID=3402176 RepID=UPI003EDC38B7
MRTRKVPYISDIHCLLGSTLRDSTSQRTGTVVGINQHSERAFIEVRWDDEQRIERVDVTLEQLNQLIQHCRARADELKASSADAQAKSSRVSTHQEMEHQPSLEETRRRA